MKEIEEAEKFLSELEKIIEELQKAGTDANEKIHKSYEEKWIKEF